MADKVIQRNDTAARWQSINPILSEGEIGIVTDGAKGYKIGDGATSWNNLPYPANPANIVQELGDSEVAVMSQKAVTNYHSWSIISPIGSIKDTYYENDTLVVVFTGDSFDLYDNNKSAITAIIPAEKTIKIPLIRTLVINKETKALEVILMPQATTEYIPLLYNEGSKDKISGVIASNIQDILNTKEINKLKGYLPYSNVILSPLNQFTKYDIIGIDIRLYFNQGTFSLFAQGVGMVDVTLPTDKTYFEIPSPRSLVYNINTKALEVVLITTYAADNNYVVLLHNDGTLLEGVLAEYLTHKRLKNRTYKDTVISPESTLVKNFKFDNNGNAILTIGIGDATFFTPQQTNISIVTTEEAAYTIPPVYCLIYDIDSSTFEVKVANQLINRNCIILLHNEYGILAGVLSDYIKGKFNIFDGLVGKNVLCIGDSITANTFCYIDHFKELTRCNIINRGINGRNIANSNTIDNSFCQRLDLDPTAPNGYPTDVDIVIVYGGINDWGNRIPFGEINADITPNTFCGALRYLFKGLKERYLNKPIYIVNQLHTLVDSVADLTSYSELSYKDNNENSSYTITTSTEGKTLYDYRNAITRVARMYGLYIIDLHKVGFSALIASDRQKYYVDGLHPNAAGGNMIAEFMVNQIKCAKIN